MCERVAVARDGEFGAGPVAPPENAVVNAVAAPGIGVGNFKIISINNLMDH